MCLRVVTFDTFVCPTLENFYSEKEKIDSLLDKLATRMDQTAGLGKFR